MDCVIWDWVFGILTRPGDTFHRAEEEMRFGYWWILLSVFTLETVMMVFGAPADLRSESLDLIPMDLLWLLILFDLQVLFAMAAARAFRWQLTWRAGVKFIGLVWAVLLAEDLVTFYPSLANMEHLVRWLSIPFVLWYLVVTAAGARRLSGISTGKAILFALMAAGPWRLGLYAMYWLPQQ
jgi:hypothetical protein